MLSGKQRRTTQEEMKLHGYSRRACLNETRRMWRCFTTEINFRVEEEYIFHWKLAQGLCPTWR